MQIKMIKRFPKEDTYSVLYFGVQIDNIGVGWLVIDPDGTLMWTQFTPDVNHFEGCWEWDAWGDMEKLALVDLNGMDWRDSRVRVGGFPKHKEES